MSTFRVTLHTVFDSSAECELSGACLDTGDPPAPAVVEYSGVTAVGDALFEDGARLGGELGLPPDAPDLLLAAAACRKWGGDATARLTGEYSFAAWDSRRRELVCARDGLGIRPLYVGVAPGRIVVSNVLRDVLAAPGMDDALDEGAMLTFLDAGASEDPARTMYRAIRILPAGHTLLFEAHGHRTRLFRHWMFPAPPELRVRDRREYPERYRAALSTAVRERVRGRRASLLLSGGLDSATIGAAAVHAGVSAGVRAFTAGYPTLLTTDEVPLARATATRLQMPMTSVTCDAGAPLGEPQSMARPLDEPMLAGWRALVGAAAGHAPIVLHGEDGDSLFVPPGWPSMRAAAPAWRIAAAAAAFALGERRLPYLGLRLRERLGLVATVVTAECSWLTPCARRALAQLEPVHVLGHTPTPLGPHPTRPAAQARLGEMIWMQLAPAITEEATLARAQLRYPLLDTRLIALVMSIPAIPWCQGKRLPRLAYRGTLPPAVLDRPKRALAGMNEALVAAWRDRTPRWPPPLPPALDRWVDRARWHSTLATGNSSDVMAAWRVLELGAWLEQGAPAGRRACTR